MQLRASPSGVPVNWTVIENFDDLPPADLSGDIILPPGGYQFSPNVGITIPIDEGIVLADGPYVINGNFGELAHATGVTTKPLLRIDNTATCVSIQNVFFNGPADIAYLQVENNGLVLTEIIGCCFNNGALHILIPTGGDSEVTKLIVNNCFFISTIDSIVMLGDSGELRVNNSTFKNLGFGVRLDAANSNSICQIIGCTFESLNTGIVWTQCAKLIANSNNFNNMAIAVLSNAAKNLMSGVFSGNSGFSGGTVFDFQVGAPNVPTNGMSVIGNHFSGWGALFLGAGVNPANADIFARANFLNGVKNSESAIIP